MVAASETLQLQPRAHEDAAPAYRRVRAATQALCTGLQAEDFVAQSMPDASPIKWHLAHTSWFFEQFLLKPHQRRYQPFRAEYEYLFNSYYQTVGSMHPRAERGLLTRPTVAEVFEYREYVDRHVLELLEGRDAEDPYCQIATLGLHHEQQHQELMLTDLKHLFAANPLKPAYRNAHAQSQASSHIAPLRFFAFEGGIKEIGATGKRFCFDNETPRHRQWLEPFALADRLITNGEYMEFIREDGYRRPQLWMSDGWALVSAEHWRHPLYWSDDLDAEFTLNGMQPLHPASPVTHLSFYEADAFARWADARLPTEAEWEVAATSVSSTAGNFVASGALHPLPSEAGTGLKQLFGDAWEWTASPYSAYPGYVPPSGALGEYNGKFMCNQMVLRGGSCVTPVDHIRATYRNFFYPHARWQFTGIRLARNS
ncbi:MAG TPA: ergothioneine biosynthesis protein EgtB [Steroidobacteraceae bacterium]|nr:ergothioneine biosynthesis protein EgtB [Steroidobacteraceae bacterium]